MFVAYLTNKAFTFTMNSSHQEPNAFRKVANKVEPHVLMILPRKGNTEVYGDEGSCNGINHAVMLLNEGNDFTDGLFRPRVLFHQDHGKVYEFLAHAQSFRFCKDGRD